MENNEYEQYINALNNVAAPHLKQKYGFFRVYFDIVSERGVRISLSIKKERTGSLVMVATKTLLPDEWEKGIQAEGVKFLLKQVNDLMDKINSYGKPQSATV